MDVSPTRLAKLLLPRLPLILKTIVLNKLSLSPNSDKQDTQTEVVVSIIRSILGSTSRPLKVIQDGSVKDLAIKGKMWIAKIHVAAPEADVRNAVIQGIKELGDGTESYTLPEITDISGEWTGFRECQKNTQRIEAPEKQQYEELMKEVTSDVTVLYFHGGAYIMMDPATHRNTTAGIAQKTGGRCFSVRYRLAPQSAFPAQLLDAFTAYLYLIAPPAGAFHEPVAPKNIVFAGDSAGGNLAYSLTLLLLTLKKAGMSSITFHGKDVTLELPAGIATNSPWTDISRALPTIYDNARFDYLDPPNATGLPKNPLPYDEIWPASPPRAEMFCTASLLTHPLASPVLATPDMWKGAPPTFMCCGNEGLEDEITVTARHIYLGGSAVEFVGYEGMPHCFAMVFPTSAAGQDCFEKWTQFMSAAVKGSVQRQDVGKWMKAFSKPPAFRDVSLGSMGITDQTVHDAIHRMKDMAMQREQDDLKRWNQESKAKL